MLLATGYVARCYGVTAAVQIAIKMAASCLVTVMDYDLAIMYLPPS